MAKQRRMRHLVALAVSGLLTAVSITNPTPQPNSGDGDTQFGASVYRGALSWPTAVQRSDDRYGNLEVVRAFNQGLPAPWARATSATDASLVVSFKASPSEILSGSRDKQLKKWFEKAPRDRDIWWSYYHEPEDNVAHGDFTAEQWREAFRHIAAIADSANNPHLHATVVLMCYTLEPSSRRSLPDYFPGSDVVDTIGWDCYSEPSTDQAYEDPSELYSTAIATSRSLGVGWGIAETGSVKASTDPTGELRAEWLRDVGGYLAGEGAEFVVYFDSVVGGEFRLLDEPSQHAWRDVISRYGRLP